MKKKKVKFMDEIEFSSSEYAKQLYIKENKKLKLKIICAFISVLTPLVWIFLFSFKEKTGAAFTTNSVLADNIIGMVLSVFLLAGIGATIISNPVQIIKTTFKLAEFGWFLVPFIIADIIAAIVCACVSVISLMFVPTFHCAVGIYQSYRNKKDAEVYCMLNNVEVE